MFSLLETIFKFGWQPLFSTRANCIVPVAQRTSETSYPLGMSIKPGAGWANNAKPRRRVTFSKPCLCNVADLPKWHFKVLVSFIVNICLII